MAIGPQIKLFGYKLRAVDNVHDFSLAEGDTLDIKDLIAPNYDPLTDAVTDFIQITDDGANSTLAVDVDGAVGGTNFVTAATLLGVTGLTDEEALETSGTLIAA